MELNIQPLKHMFTHLKTVTATFVFIMAMVCVPTYSRAVDITKDRVKECYGDYRKLCSKYTAVTDIHQCFISNWSKVSKRCKEAK